MFCQSRTNNPKHNVPAVNCFHKHTWPCKKINLLKGFQKKPWPYLFWLYPSPQRCSSFLCHDSIWIALDVSNIFFLCCRHSIDICVLDAMQRYFTLSVICFKQIEALLKKKTIILTSLSSHSCYLTQRLTPTFILLRPSLFILHFCCFWKFASQIGKSAFKTRDRTVFMGSFLQLYFNLKEWLGHGIYLFWRRVIGWMSQQKGAWVVKAHLCSNIVWEGWRTIRICFIFS